MRYWIGLLLVALSGWLLLSAYQWRREVALARASARLAGRPADPAPASARLAGLGEMVTPLAVAFLVYVAVKMSFAFYYFGALEFFSVFDLAAFYLLLASYGTWLVCKTRYRLPANVVPRIVPSPALQEAAAGARHPRVRRHADEPSSTVRDAA